MDIKVTVKTEEEDINDALKAAGEAYKSLTDAGFTTKGQASITHDRNKNVWKTSRRFWKAI